MQDIKDRPQWGYTAEPRTYDSAEEGSGGLSKEPQSVEWTATEFIAHEKNAGWYVLMIIGSVVVSGLIYWLTRDWLSSLTVFLAAGAFILVGAKKPQNLKYRLNNQGISIASKSYLYEDFKSFSIIDEGAASSIYLMPLKRFMPSISLYYSPKDEDRIVEILQNYLPHEYRDSDPIDRLMHKIRF